MAVSSPARPKLPLAPSGSPDAGAVPRAPLLSFSWETESHTLAFVLYLTSTYPAPLIPCARHLPAENGQCLAGQVPFAAQDIPASSKVPPCWGVVPSAPALPHSLQAGPAHLPGMSLLDPSLLVIIIKFHVVV